MKQSKLLLMTLMAGALLATSCASKKELQNCQNENKELTGNYQNAKEQLAASQARVTSLEDQLAQMKKDYSSMQAALGVLIVASQLLILVLTILEFLLASTTCSQKAPAIKVINNNLLCFIFFPVFNFFCYYDLI